jgi:hypothetical protein
MVPEHHIQYLDLKGRFTSSASHVLRMKPFQYARARQAATLAQIGGIWVLVQSPTDGMPDRLVIPTTANDTVL